MGRNAHENGEVARHAVLWEVQNATRKRYSAIVENSNAWLDVSECDEYMRKVHCGLGSCKACRRALPH